MRFRIASIERPVNFTPLCTFRNKSKSFALLSKKFENHVKIFLILYVLAIFNTIRAQVIQTTHISVDFQAYAVLVVRVRRHPYAYAKTIIHLHTREEVEKRYNACSEVTLSLRSPSSLIGCQAGYGRSLGKKPNRLPFRCLKAESFCAPHFSFLIFKNQVAVMIFK